LLLYNNHERQLPLKQFSYIFLTCNLTHDIHKRSIICVNRQREISLLIKSETTCSKLLTLDLIFISHYFENDLMVGNTTQLVVNLFPPNFKLVKVSIIFSNENLFWGHEMQHPLPQSNFSKNYLVWNRNFCARNSCTFGVHTSCLPFH
jgi:hypothetical protein